MGKVAVVMGSTSDLPVMEEAVAILKEFGIVVDVDIVSAHRTPDKLFDFRVFFVGDVHSSYMRVNDSNIIIGI